MPELPEVETTQVGLLPAVAGRSIQSVLVRDRRLRWPVPENLEIRLQGATIQTIQRRGKYLLFGVRKQGLRDHLLVHLGMSGSLRLVPDSTAAARHDHIEIRIVGGPLIRYTDPRRFGCWLWAGQDWAKHPLLAKLGPEPFDEGFNAAYLHNLCRKRIASIKSVIMNADVVTGVGNIYANEALFRAGIHPAQAAGRLSAKRLNHLVDCIRDVLQDAIRAGGSSIRDYVQSDGASGWFQLQYFVYGRADQPCRRCGSSVKQSRHSQRATYFCPNCQRR